MRGVGFWPGVGLRILAGGGSYGNFIQDQTKEKNESHF